MTTDNCGEAPPSSAFPALDPAVGLDLGVVLEDIKRALLLYQAVLVSGGGIKGGSDVLEGIFVL